MHLNGESQLNVIRSEITYRKWANGLSINGSEKQVGMRVCLPCYGFYTCLYMAIIFKTIFLKNVKPDLR